MFIKDSEALPEVITHPYNDHFYGMIIKSLNNPLMI